MTASIAQNAGVYTELSALSSLKGQLKSGDPAVERKVAEQFEAIFMQMMLSGMRKTIEVNEEYGNDKAMYYDLFDKQVALSMSSNGGIGLADILMKQNAMGQPKDLVNEVNESSLTNSSLNADQKQARVNNTEFVLQKQIADRTAGQNEPAAVNESTEKLINFNSPAEFISTLWGLAKDIITDSGLDPKAVIAQAALETGWGKHIIKKPNGDSSFNLFGIKSDSSWAGDEALANTHEFKHGRMFMTREGFRAYDSLQESVRDYVEFLKGKERYQQALQNLDNPQQFVAELQAAGYATDPNYASKIQYIMQRDEFSLLKDESYTETSEG
jgi:flagellar protein FlgJ